MSDAPSPEPAPEPVPESAAEPTPEPTAPAAAVAPHRRWRRRLAWTAAVLVALVPLAHVGAKVALEPVLRAVARGLGLELQLDHSMLSLLGGEVELRNLTARPLAGGDVVASLEYLRADLSVTSLLAGHVVVERVEVDGVALHLERDSGGAWGLPGVVAPPAKDDDADVDAEDAEDTDVAKADDAALALPDLSWLRVDAISIRRVRCRLVDPASALDVEAAVDLRLAALDGSPTERPATLDVLLSAPPVLDRLRLEGTLALEPRSIRWRLATRADGLHPRRLQAILAPLGLTALARTLDARATVDGALVPSTVAAGALSVDLSLSDLAVVADGRADLAVGSVVARVDALGREDVLVDRVLVDDIVVEATRTVAGALRASGFELSSAPSAPAAAPAAVAPAAAPPPQAPGQTASAPPSLLVRTLDVHQARVTWNDEQAGTALGLHLRDLTLAQVHFGPGAPPEPLRLAVTLALPDVADEVTLVGTADLSHRRWSFDVDASARGITAQALAPYLEQAGFDDLLGAGEVTFHATGAAELTADRAFTLEAALRDVRFADAGRELAGADEVLLEGVRVSPIGNGAPPTEVSVARVAVRRPRAHARLDAEGGLTLGGVRVRPTSGRAQTAANASTSPPPTTTQAPAPPLPRLVIGVVSVEGATARFEDALVSPAVTFDLTDAGLLVEDVLLEPDGTPAPASLRAWAEVAGAGRLTVEGTLYLSPLAPSVALHVTGESLSLEPVAPYLRALGLGLEGRLHDGALEVVANASVTRDGDSLTVDAAVKRVRLASGPDELFLLEGARVSGAQVVGQRVRVRALEVARVSTVATRTAQGALEALGVSIAGVTSAAPTALRLPVELSFTCGPLAFDAGGRDPLTDAPYRLELRAPGVVDRVVVEGALAATPSAVRARAQVTLEGLLGAEADAVVAALGLENAPRGAALALAARADLTRDAEGVLGGEAHLERLALTRAEEELVGVDAIHAVGLAVAPGELGVEWLQVVSARAKVEGGPGGALALAGLRLAPAQGADFALTARADLLVEGLEYHGAGVASPASFTFALQAPGVVDRLDGRGVLIVSAEAPGLELVVDATGVQPGPMSAYLPPAIRVDVQDGRFHAGLGARVYLRGDAVDGSFAVRDVVWRDGPDVDGAPPALLRVEAVDVELDRLAKDELGFERVHVSGVETSLDLAPGRTSALGVTIAPVTTTQVEAPPAAVTAVDATPTPTPDATPPARAALPLIRVDDLRLEGRRLEVRRPGAAPVVASLTLRSDGPVRLGGRDPAGEPPVVLVLTGEVAPLVSALHVRLEAAPFAPEPALRVAFHAAGLRGAGLLAALPELAAAGIEVAPHDALTDGAATARLALVVRARRSDTTDFSFLGRPFGLELTLDDVAVRADASSPPGPVLAGVSHVGVDVASIDPTTGDVRVREVEIVRPALRAAREADGFHVLGLVLPPPPPPPPASEAAPTPAAEPASAPAGPPPPELSVDTLVVSEIDVVVADRTVDPAVVVPLTGFDLSVHGFTTRMLTERRLLRFDLALEGGEVALPGARRRFVEEVVVTGEVGLWPTLVGRVQAHVSTLELATFAGMAKQSGVDVSDGAADVNATLRFHDDGRIDVVSLTRLERLDLSEGEDGFLRGLLGLPAPTNVVIGVLTVEDAMELPVDLELTSDGLGVGAILKVAGSVIGSLFVDRIKGTPGAALGGIADLGVGLVRFGLGVEEEEEGDGSIVLAFESGDTALRPAERAKLDAVLEQLADDPTAQVRLQYVPGGADLVCLGQAAQPSAEDLRDVVRNLRERWRALERQREAATAEARAAFIAGITPEALAAAERAAALDVAVGEALRALEAACAGLRGADGARWLRRSLLAVGDERLAAVQRALLAGLEACDDGEEPAARIRVGRARVPDGPGGEAGQVRVLVRAKKD